MNACYSAGIDLHSNNSYLAVIDEDGKLVFCRRLANSLELLLTVLSQYKAQLRGIVVESTFNWYWLVDALLDVGYHVELINPAALHQYEGLKHKDDKSDALWLAECLRLGLTKNAQGYICPRESRQVRDLLRKRGQLVHQRTSNILSIQNLVARNTGGHIKGSDVKKLTEADVYAMFSGEVHLSMPVLANLHVIQALDQEIQTLEKEVNDGVKDDSQFALLMSVCGIGRILAMTIFLETGDINRFPRVGNYASYCRCVDSKHTSNAKLKGRGNRKNGNRYLAWAFVEAAHFAIRYYPEVNRYYQRKVTKTRKVVAIKAVAHKLARASYWVMKNGEAYDMKRAFG